MSARAILLKTPTDIKEYTMAEQSSADFFTRDDRYELMRQGLQLTSIIKAMEEAKASLLISTTSHELRITSLEVTRTELRAQIKATVAWVSLFAAVVGSGVHLLLDWLKHT